jgi:hypothetical protein
MYGVEEHLTPPRDSILPSVGRFITTFLTSHFLTKFRWVFSEIGLGRITNWPGKKLNSESPNKLVRFWLAV